MAKKNEKSQKQQEQAPSKQRTTPAAQVELSEEELGQVVGGVQSSEGGGATNQQHALDAC